MTSSPDTGRCPRGLDPARLSGLLDGELTQQEEQRLRIHLEDCSSCRATLAELTALREVTMSTRFVEHEAEPGERARGWSLGLRSLGWLLGGVWLAIAGGWALWQAWRGEPNAFERFVAFGGAGAALLLLLSVVVDRLRERRSDPYREVRR